MTRDFLLKERKIWSVAALLVVIYGFFNSTFVETQIWRDLTAQTPFHSVRVDRVELVDHGPYGAIQVWGQFTKRRCDRVGLFVYTRDAAGVWSFADFASLEGAEVPLSRPGDGTATSFGPWRITALKPAPTAARMVTVHACPNAGAENETRQVTRVFQIPWAAKPPKSEK